MKEIWKDIKNYEGLYQISNLGKIKSFSRGENSNKEKILKLKYDKYGYMCIDLWKNKSVKTFKVHRLVAQAFIPNPHNYPVVNHKNKMRDDNIVDNLEWCTIKYNCQYSKAKAVLQCDLNGNVIKRWDCIREASRKLKICNGDICKCCKKKKNTCGGFLWKYVEA